jgi:hypothetical protein
MATSRVVEALNRHLIRSERHSVKAVAAKMGISMSTLYAYIEGQNPFPLERLPSLYAATQDVQLIADLVGCCESGLTLVADPAAGDVGNVATQALKVGAASGEVTSTVLRALDDNRIDDREAHEIAKAVEGAQREGEGLRLVARKAVGA